MSLLVFALLASAGLSWSLLALSLPALKRRLLDQPNQRSSHFVPTPRGGGYAFVLVASLAPLLLRAFNLSGYERSTASLLPLVCIPLAFVGFLDDRHNLSASIRYGVQIGTALALIVFVRPWMFVSGDSMVIFWVSFPLLVLAVTAVINFINFMDGLDGLVAGCLALMLTVASVHLTTPAFLPLVGALIGFLVWNWSPARVFMGDVGSTFLGAMFAGAVLLEHRIGQAIGLLLVGFPLLGDAFLCVLRRLIAGQSIFQAHRLHLFQRLHQAGWPHARVSCLYIAATAFLAIALLVGGWQLVVGCAAIELVVGVVLDQRVAVPFVLASKY